MAKMDKNGTVWVKALLGVGEVSELGSKLLCNFCLGFFVKMGIKLF